MIIASMSDCYNTNYMQNSSFDTKLYSTNGIKFSSLFSRNKTQKVPHENADYLTQEEFNNTLKILDKRIKKNKILLNSDDVKLIREKLNRFNAVLFEKYLDKELYVNNSSKNYYIKGIISNIDNPDDAIKFNKIISNENLLKSDYLMNIFRISQSDKNSEKNSPYKHLLNTILENENLYKNECIIKNLDTIAQLTQSPNGRMLVYNVFLNDDFSKKYLKGAYRFTVSEDYIKNQHNLKIEKNDGSQIITFALKNDEYEVLSDESIYFSKGINDLSIKKDKDGNTFISVVKYNTYYDGFFPNDVPVTQKNTKYDKDGSRIYTEIKRSKFNKPELYTYVVTKPGKKPVFAYNALSDKDDLLITKKFKSPESILTASSYKLDADNSTNFSYKVTDSSGNELLNIERKFEKIDDNHYVSTLNDKKYEIEYAPAEVIVKSSDKDNNKSADKIRLIGRFDPNLENLYKQLPGDLLLQFKNTNTKIEFNNFNKEKSGHYDDKSNRIFITGVYSNVPFVLMHEAGHAYDCKIENLSSDEKLKKIFDEELLNYKENSTFLEGESIDYFTTLIHQNNDNCLTEVVAETNAIISGFYNNAEDDIKLREIVLEQNFPRTIAYIANKIIDNN